MARLTLIHVILSIVALVLGQLLILAFLTGRKIASLNGIFLIMTTATSVTGFLFPFQGVTPGIVIGLVSLLVLIVAAIALARKWSRTYVISAQIAQFLNVLVLIRQLFAKLPGLHHIAPTGTEPIVGSMYAMALLVFFIVAVKTGRRPPYRLC